MPLNLVKTLFTEESGLADPEIPADVLIAESNHRIANNLTVIAGLVRLHAADVAKTTELFTPQDVCVLLKEVGGRIETVSRLHRLLAEAARGKTPDLSSYLRDIAQAVVASLSSSGTAARLRADTDDCLLPANQALSVGFIVGELVTNAVKYAHPSGVTGEIAMTCRRHSDRTLVVEVCDDGVGLPEGFDPLVQGGLGLRLVRSLATQLGAKLTFNQSGLGLCVRLCVPPNRPIAVD